MPDPVEKLSRRILLKRLAGGAGLALAGSHIGDVLAQSVAPAAVTADKLRPLLPGGVMSGDVTASSAIVWSRTDRPSRMIVDYSTSESFKRFERRVGPAALDSSDFTARIDLTDLPPGADVFYRVRFQDLVNDKVFSEPVTGRLRTAALSADRPVTFVFSGDEAGQGWGINERFGGYRIYEAMRRESPDFFIHSGDQIYADGPLQSEVKLPDGTLWTNLVTEPKSHVAQTLDDYRGAFAYNQLDVNKRRFMAEVPFLVQWDDHEVRNNWYPGQQIGAEEKRYQTRAISLLAARAKQAMFEYNPFRINPLDPEQVYRGFQFGPLLDVFMLDERSYRGPNSPNRQTQLDRESAFLGAQQAAWLKQSLKNSKAAWKVIASDMPISLIVPDLNPGRAEGHLRSVGQWRQWRAVGTRTGVDGHPALHQAREYRERRLGHGRCPLCTGDALRSVAREVHGVQAVLGVRRRADQCGHIRSERTRHDVRPGVALRQRPEGQSAEPVAGGETAVLRPRENRSGEPDDDGIATRPRRPLAV